MHVHMTDRGDIIKAHMAIKAMEDENVVPIIKKGKCYFIVQIGDDKAKKVQCYVGKEKLWKRRRDER